MIKRKSKSRILPSSSDRCISSIESFGTLNWSVCVPKKRAIRSANNESTCPSRASPFSDNSMSFNERPPCGNGSVWMSEMPSPTFTSPLMLST